MVGLPRTFTKAQGQWSATKEVWIYPDGRVTLVRHDGTVVNDAIWAWTIPEALDNVRRGYWRETTAPTCLWDEEVLW